MPGVRGPAPPMAARVWVMLAKGLAKTSRKTGQQVKIGKASVEPTAARPDVSSAMVGRMSLPSFIDQLRHSQHRDKFVCRRQTAFALSVAFVGAAVLAVVGARASEPLDHASGIKSSGGSIDPPPLLLRPLARSAAIELNDSLPFSKDIQYPAAPFRFSGDASARERALECLATAIYYEAASEGSEGQEAVAQVILNRVRSPRFPSTICSVIYQGSLLKTGCQFSFTCDGSLQRAVWKREWLHARQIADRALAGAVMPQVGLSTHYHTIDVVPYWATSLAKDARIGRHIFYRWPGGLGRPGAFRQQYAKNEPDPVMLRATALVAKGIWPATMEAATRPEIQVRMDPQLEAQAIVELLGREPASEPSSFEAAARAHFGNRFATGSPDGPTVTAEKDGLETPVVPAAARSDEPESADLAPSSAMRQFLRAHRHDYQAAAVRTEQKLQQFAADWQTYSGTTIERQRLKLQLSDSLNQQRCLVGPPTGPRALHAIAVRQADYDLLMASGLPNSLVTMKRSTKTGDNRALASLLEAVRADIVFAVFSRIEALSEGPEEQALVLRLAAAEGRSLVPVLANRLKAFENDRVRYPTLSDFLPQLLIGLPIDQLGNTPAMNDATIGCRAFPSPIGIASAVIDGKPASLIATRDRRP